MITSGPTIITSHGSGTGGEGVTTPGGSNGQIQFNHANAFGGVVGSIVDATTGAITLTSAPSTTALTVIGPSDASSSAFGIHSGVDASNIIGYVGTDRSEMVISDVTGSLVDLQASTGLATITLTNSDASTLLLSPVSIGFFSSAGAAKQTVTGVKLPSDTVMASLLAALVAYGLITNSTT